MKNIKKTLSRSFWFKSFYFLGMWVVKYPAFIRDYFKIKKLSKNSRFPILFKDIYPCLFDNIKKTSFDPHYIYHSAWAARIIANKIKPSKHVDISSILYFSTLVSAFVPVEFYDYRPAEIKLNNLECKKADLTKLPFENNSIESISCMHTVEHVGLGRYGDPIDPDGDIKAVNELIRVVKPGGSLLFVVPVGRPKIEFNAHRIYSYEQISGYFNELKLNEFSLITDNGDFKENASIELVKEQNYGCGCFWFIKK